MSKLSKLLSNPSLFFKDAIKNKVDPQQKALKSIKPETQNAHKEKKPAPKTVAKLTTKSTANSETKTVEKKTMAAAPKPAPTLIYDAINPFKRYPHVIHTGEGMTHGPSHLSQWIPFFVQANQEFAVLVRNMDLYKWVRENFPYIAVIYAKNPIDVENILTKLAFVKGIYYLSNTGNMIHTLRFNVYQHIFLGHGDSDKSASAHKFFRVYDEIWVAGQAHIDRFKHAGFKTRHMGFVKVGRPQLANVMKQNEADWKVRQTPRILYLPTWEGVYEEGNYSSARISAAMLTEIYNRFGLHISAKFHPVTGSRDKILANAPQYVAEELQRVGASFTIADKLVPVSELLLTTNIYICDISAVVSECIAANGPIFVYIPADKEIKTSQSDMKYEDYAYTFSNIEELCEKLEQVLNGNDYLKEQRQKAMDYLLTVNATRNNEFANKLKEVAEKNYLLDNAREEVIQ